MNWLDRWDVLAAAGLILFVGGVAAFSVPGAAIVLGLVFLATAYGGMKWAYSRR